MFHRDKSNWQVFSNTGSSAAFTRNVLRKLRGEGRGTPLSLSAFFSSSPSSSPSPLSFSSGWFDNVQQKMEDLFRSENESPENKASGREKGEKKRQTEDAKETKSLVSWKQLYLQHHFEDAMSLSSATTSVKDPKAKPSTKSRSEIISAIMAKTNKGKAPTEKVLPPLATKTFLL